MKKELIVFKDPKSPISEVFKTLRTNIQFMNTKGKLRTLLVTSTLPGEGKSWISSNLAVTFAQAGKKVVILDADMRKGRQYNIFGVSPRPGLSNYLSGFDLNEEETLSVAECIQATEVEKLYIISSGNVPPNPSELLVSERMLELIDNLKKNFDIVIIDGPPTQLVTDSLILARIADSTVIIAESNKTKKENLRRIIDNIQNVGGKIAGVVLNKVQLSAKKYEQTYYYGSNSAHKKNKNGTNFKFSNMNDSIKQSMNMDKQKNEGQVEKETEIASDENKSDYSQINEYNKLEENTKFLPNNEKFESSIENEESNSIKENIEQIDSNEGKFEDTQIQEDATRNFREDQIQEQKNYNSNFSEDQNPDKNQLDEKTLDIIRQVNEYMENERKNLNQ